METGDVGAQAGALRVSREQVELLDRVVVARNLARRVVRGHIRVAELDREERVGRERLRAGGTGGAQVDDAGRVVARSRRVGHRLRFEHDATVAAPPDGGRVCLHVAAARRLKSRRAVSLHAAVVSRQRGEVAARDTPLRRHRPAGEEAVQPARAGDRGRHARVGPAHAVVDAAVHARRQRRDVDALHRRIIAHRIIAHRIVAHRFGLYGAVDGVVSRQRERDRLGALGADAPSPVFFVSVAAEFGVIVIIIIVTGLVLGLSRESHVPGVRHGVFLLQRAVGQF